MNERKIWFRPAILRNERNASISLRPRPSASGRRNRMLSGTVASISASSESYPRKRAMASTSAGRGPMWRGTKLSASVSGPGPRTVRAPPLGVIVVFISRVCVASSRLSNAIPVGPLNPHSHPPVIDFRVSTFDGLSFVFCLLSFIYSLLSTFYFLPLYMSRHRCDPRV